MQKKINERNVSLDLLRIFFCYCIIILHESGFIIDYPIKWTSFQLMVRPALFAFVSISGYFLLNSCDISNTKKFYIKRLSTLVIPLVIYSILIQFAANIIDKQGFFYGFSKDFWVNIYSGRITSHLWFVYSMIALYIVTPYIKIFLDKLNNKQLIVFLVLIFFFIGINPILDYYGYGTTITIIFANSMFFYYVLGYLISKIDFTNRKIGSIAVLEIISIVSVMLYFRKQLYIQTTLWTTSIFMVIGVVFYFALAEFLTDKIPGLFNKTISFISARTYSIYIIHFFILQQLANSHTFKYTQSNAIYLVLLKSLIIFSISLVVTIIVDLLVVNSFKKINNKLFLK